MVGAIASLKTAEPNMALMPAGTMRFVKNEDGEFMKDASGFDAEKKGKMFDVALPE